MKQKIVLSLLVATASFMTGCSSDKQPESVENLPCIIDVKKDYPEKEIVLTDIADVTYVHLSSKNDNFLYKGGINYVSENTIIVCDISSGSVLFFKKDGTPISRFNHYGEGPQEYQTLGMTFNRAIDQLFYDEKTNEVFIYMPFSDFIKVYTSTGEYLRTINVPQGSPWRRYSIYDNQSLIVNDEKAFYLISRTDGKILEYIKMPDGDKVDLDVKYVRGKVNMTMKMMGGTRMVKCADGYYLCNPESDTVFLYKKDKSLTPAILKTPMIGNLDPKTVLNKCWDAGRYQFIEIHTRHKSYYLSPESPEYPDRHYVQNKKTGEVFRQKIIIPDYMGKEIFIFNISIHEKGTSTHFELDLAELKEAFKKNMLGGKLKELVATLDEFQDNNVYMFVDFK